MARQAGAKIYMRMEDIDAGRAKPESVAQAYEDLQWLGMDWDGWEKSEDRRQKSDGKGAVVQSERMDLYAAALERLWQAGAVYPCTCTRADIVASVAAGASAPHEGEGHPRYPGTCGGKYEAGRSNGESAVAAVAHVFAQTGKAACFRLRVADGPVEFRDLVAGEQVFNVAADAGDFPITRFAEHRGDAVMLPPAYQLACVVDDHAMGIDRVIRGDDLLASTPRQILLYRALGFEPPHFAHLPLVVGPDGKRLAKRHGESRIAPFREAGAAAERIVGWAAWRSGQLEKPRSISAGEMVAAFDLSKLPRERIVLCQEDVAWLGTLEA